MLMLIALLLPVVLLFVGFSVDLAYMQTTRLELRAAADVAARAGATALSQTDNSTFAVRTAKQIARQNFVAGDRLLLRDSDIEVGRSTVQADGKWAFTPGGSPPNAVRVTAPRTAASRGGTVPLFFGSLIGRADFDPVQAATASFINYDICLVLDRSTSMKLNVTGESGGMYTNDPRFCAPATATSRWMALDEAVQVFLDELNNSVADEQVALATYSSALTGRYASLCGASGNASSLDADLHTDLSRISSAMNTLSTTVWNGNTFIESGMLQGLAALQDARYARNTATKVMIVLTDGNENVGSAVAAANTISAAGVVIHTITFSDEANQALMQSVASIGNGQHYHANTAAQLRNVFKELAAVATGLTQ